MSDREFERVLMTLPRLIIALPPELRSILVALLNGPVQQPDSCEVRSMEFAFGRWWVLLDGLHLRTIEPPEGHHHQRKPTAADEF